MPSPPKRWPRRLPSPTNCLPMPDAGPAHEPSAHGRTRIPTRSHHHHRHRCRHTAGHRQCSGTISIAKEVGQASKTIVQENIQKMWSALPAPSRKNAIWCVSDQLEEQLDAMGTISASSTALYFPNATNGPTLKGRPVIQVEQCPSAGQPWRYRAGGYGALRDRRQSHRADAFRACELRQRSGGVSLCASHRWPPDLHHAGDAVQRHRNALAVRDIGGAMMNSRRRLRGRRLKRGLVTPATGAAAPGVTPPHQMALQTACAVWPRGRTRNRPWARRPVPCERPATFPLMENSYVEANLWSPTTGTLSGLQYTINNTTLFRRWRRRIPAPPHRPTISRRRR